MNICSVCVSEARVCNIINSCPHIWNLDGSEPEPSRDVWIRGHLKRAMGNAHPRCRDSSRSVASNPRISDYNKSP